MEKQNRISAEQCCHYYSIEVSFLQQLYEHGLIELTRYESNFFIHYEQLPHLEKYIRMHYDLDINLQGLEAIKHLLTRIQHLQQEVNRLQNEAGQP